MDSIEEDLWPCPVTTSQSLEGDNSYTNVLGSESCHDETPGEDSLPENITQRLHTHPACTNSAEPSMSVDMRQAKGEWSLRVGYEKRSSDTPFEKALVDTPSKTKAKKSARKRRKLTTSALRATHDHLQTLREEVEAKRTTLSHQYNSLARRIDEVSLSQQELMHEFETCLENKSLEENTQQLRNLWQTCCHGVTAFHDRLSEIERLVDLEVLPQARLIAAEISFIDEGQRIMEALPDNEKFAAIGAPTKSSLIDKLSHGRKELGFVKERLSDIHFEHAEESDQREFLYDRGDCPEISDFRFEQEYHGEQGLTEWNLRQANAKIAELEKACVERGRNISATTDHQRTCFEWFSAVESSNSEKSWHSKSRPPPVLQPGVTAWIEKLEGQEQDDPSEWLNHSDVRDPESGSLVPHADNE